MKKFQTPKSLFTLFTLSALLLSACNSSSEGGRVEEGSTLATYSYRTSEFTIEAPRDWETITGFGSDFPEELRVAFRNNVKDRDHLANIVVHREQLEDVLTSTEFGQEKLQDSQNSLLDFSLISSEDIELEVAGGLVSTQLYSFSGKTEDDIEETVFLQSTLTKGNKAWVVTASHIPTENPFVVQALENSLKSFTLR